MHIHFYRKGLLQNVKKISEFFQEVLGYYPWITASSINN